MKTPNNYYHKLIDFLKGSQHQTNRKDIVEWYEGISSSDVNNDKNIAYVTINTKRKILKSIQQNKLPKNSNQWLVRISAAAALLLVGIYSYQNFFDSDFKTATEIELASISPARNKAVIILSDGQQVDLDKIGINESIKIRETIIKKDAEGKVTYHNYETNKLVIQHNTLQVPKAGTYQITLVDGTIVTLNSKSKLTYPTSFGKGDRVVKLDGEGYFQVKKSVQGSRFIVQSQLQNIEVLGTKFNVKAYSSDKEIFTTLEEGSVSVKIPSYNKFQLIMPSEQAVVNRSGQLSTRKINLEEVLSWTNNQFYFNGNNTQAVMNEIGRWYDIDINYENASKLTEYAGKIPRNLSLNKLIELLIYAEFKVKAIVDDNKRVKLIIT